MTLNYNTNRKELEDAYKRVTESADGDKWVIYDYEGNSNTLKVGEEGVGGLDDFSTSFSSGKLQFGVIAVRLSSDVIPKIVLIHWQGEGVPTLRLASTTSHAEEFRRFLKSVHIVLHARSEIDVEPDIIRKEVLKLPAANTSANVESSYSVPEKVESVYRPVKPQAELSSTARDDFWNKMNDEEKKRQNEEKKLRDVQQKKYEEDRKRTANEIHSQAESYQPEKVTSVYKPVKPHVELKSSQREEFWNKMNEEEKKRQEEERKLREAQQKQFEADRQRTAQEIHSQAESYQPDKVTSVYKPVKPHVELNSSAREEFWSKMNEEEKRRVEEEKKANEAKKKQFEDDHRRISNDIHAKLQIQQETISSEAEKKENGTKPIVITGGLVGSRKEIFNNKDSEPLAPLPKSISNSGGVKKWPPVSTNRNDNESVPINRFDKNENSKTESIPAAPEEPRHVYKPEVMVPTPTPTYNNSYNEAAPTEHAPAPPPPEPTPTKYLSQYDSPPVFEAPEAQEVAPSYYSSQYDAVPELPPSEPENYGYVSKKAEEDVPAHIASQYDMPPVLPEESIPSAQIDRYDFPPTIEASNDQKALALWDYQAADDTEISFDPDDIITEIDQVDSGWWKGKAPNGRIGLFPANYVKLL